MNIQNELSEFLFLCEELRKCQNFKIETPCPYVLSLSPQGDHPDSQSSRKQFSFTVMGLTHGNETAGIGVINSFLKLVLHGIVQVPISMAIVLGNIEASIQGKRFWQHDLNRSFGINGNSASNYEEKRAIELAPILGASLFFLDLHQTIEPSAHPFFIFPFNKRSFEFARAIGYRHQIVTHWGQPFSAAGKCTDDFVNDQGGIGISIELGQKGQHPEQMALGLELILNAIAEIRSFLRTGTWLCVSKNISSETPRGELFTFNHIERCEAGSEFQLRPGLRNFDPIAIGATLGTINGKAFCAPADGHILFPKYTPAMPGKPTEIVRIVKVISEEELPK